MDWDYGIGFDDGWVMDGNWLKVDWMGWVWFRGIVVASQLRLDLVDIDNLVGFAIEWEGNVASCFEKSDWVVELGMGFGGREPIEDEICEPIDGKLLEWRTCTVADLKSWLILGGAIPEW